MARHAAAVGQGAENDVPPGQAAAIRSPRTRCCHPLAEDTLLLVDESSMIPMG